jgi:hypothetical protein
VQRTESVGQRSIRWADAGAGTRCLAQYPEHGVTLVGVQGHHAELLGRGEPPSRDDPAGGEPMLDAGQALPGQATGVRGHDHQLPVGRKAQKRSRFPRSGRLGSGGR